MLLSVLDNIFVLKQCTMVQVTINTTTASHHSPHSSWTLLVNTYMRQGSMNLCVGVWVGWCVCVGGLLCVCVGVGCCGVCVLCGCVGVEGMGGSQCQH